MLPGKSSRGGIRRESEATRARDSRDRIVADATVAEGMTGGIVTADAEDSIGAVAAATTDFGDVEAGAGRGGANREGTPGQEGCANHEPRGAARALPGVHA